VYVTVSYPEYVVDRIKRIASTFNVPEEQVWEMFNTYLNDPFVKTDPQFKTDDDRYRYVLELLWVVYAAQPPAETVLFISVGYTDVRVTKQGPISRIYGLAKKKGQEKFSRAVIICKGPQAELTNEVVPFRVYKVKLSSFGRADNVYFATNQTKFADPQPIPMDPLQFIAKEVGVPVIKLADAASALSKRQDKYIDEFDWRGLVGIVVKYNYGTRPSGTKWAVYTVSDDSLTSNYISPEGLIVPTAFTVWVPFNMMRYDVDSKLFFCWDADTRGRQGGVHERHTGVSDNSEAFVPASGVM
jgi:hypothetical protein